MLHTISSSTIDVEFINHTDAVLFWQDGVILTISNQPVLIKILEKTSNCYALDNDLFARGLTKLMDKRVKMITMEDVVDLTAKHHPQMKW